MTTWRAWMGTLLVCALTALAQDALAQASEADKAAARELAIEAQNALTAGKYEEAAQKFDRADQLYHAPTLVLGLARAYAGLGKFVEAKEAYNRVIREKLPENASEAFVKAVEDARSEIGPLDEKIGWGTITVTAPGGEQPEGLQVTLDGEELKSASLGVKRPLNPGSHQVAASAPGFARAEKSFEVAPKGNVEVALELAPATGGGGGDTGEAPQPGKTQRLLGWVGIGVGGAGLIVGAITGGLAVSKHGELSDQCPEGQCPDNLQGDIDGYNTVGTVSTIGFIAGGVLAATGVVLLITAPSGDGGGDTAALPLELGVGPGSVQARLRF